MAVKAYAAIESAFGLVNETAKCDSAGVCLWAQDVISRLKTIDYWAQSISTWIPDVDVMMVT